MSLWLRSMSHSSSVSRLPTPGLYNTVAVTWCLLNLVQQELQHTEAHMSFWGHLKNADLEFGKCAMRSAVLKVVMKGHLGWQGTYKEWVQFISTRLPARIPRVEYKLPTCCGSSPVEISCNRYLGMWGLQWPEDTSFDPMYLHVTSSSNVSFIKWFKLLWPFDIASCSKKAEQDECIAARLTSNSCMSCVGVPVMDFQCLVTFNSTVASC